jgi:hypothetical protein
LIYTFIQARVKEMEERRMAEKKKQLGTRTGLEAYSTLGAGIGCPRNKKKFGSNRSKGNEICFGFVSVCS